MTPTTQLSFPDENEIARIAALTDAAERNTRITDSYSKLSAEVDRRIQGHADLWITEYTIIYNGQPSCVVSIMEFCNNKVIHETQYFSEPFKAPEWRSQWVEQIA